MKTASSPLAHPAQNTAYPETDEIAFTGGVYDAETGLYYLMSRYYDPAIAQFISEDSYRGDGEHFWNLYMYCEGDPVNNTDREGCVPSKNGKYIISISSIMDSYFAVARSLAQPIWQKFRNLKNSVFTTLVWPVELTKPFIEAGNALWMFIKYVKTGGALDLKNKSNFKSKYFNYSKQYALYYRGKKWDYDDPGNILFGYFAKKCGLTKQFACMGAGLYQLYYDIKNKRRIKLSSYGDDPKDTANIKYGYELG